MLCFPDRELPFDHPERKVLATVAALLGVPPRRVALTDSMTDYIRTAMAVEPRLRDIPRQAMLTAQHLHDEIPGLMALFRQLRTEIDPELRRRTGSTYPVGQCLEITQAVLARLNALGPPPLKPAELQAWRSLSGFRAAGGEVRRAWGDLRGQYFQNALLVGTLYVDVANDTVVASKPPVEILPVAEADFRPVVDHGHFARIAAKYWNLRILPNHVLPELAPFAPLIEIAPNGALRLGPLTPYMLSVALAGRFVSSEAFLNSDPPPAAIFQGLSAALRKGPVAAATDPYEGRLAALAACRTARRERRFDCPATFNRAIAQAHAVNRRLAEHVAVVPAAA